MFLLFATIAEAQTIAATNGALQSSRAVFFPSSGAFFPFASTTAVESNRFPLSLTTDFAKPATSTAYSVSEMYRYQLRLLDSDNKAVILSSGNSLITTEDFTISLTDLGKNESRTQSFMVQPNVALPISSKNHSVSVILQRRTLDTSGFPKHVWVDQGAAVTLALTQEIGTPQLRISSASATEMRLSYTYATPYGAEVYARWKLLASPSLEANSFSAVTGLTVTAGPNNEYSYTVPISPTTTPKQFFRLGN